MKDESQPNRRNEIIAFLFIAFTFMVQFSIFWEYQIRIWNRVSYSVGQWSYSIPYFDRTSYPTETYLQTIITRIMLMVFVSTVFTIAMLSFLRAIRSKQGDVRIYGSLVILSFAMFFSQIWALKSFELAPQNWIFSEIPNLPTDRWKIGIFSLPNGGNGETRYNFLHSVLIVNLLNGLISTLSTATFFAVKLKTLRNEKNERKGVAVQPSRSKAQLLSSLVFYLLLFGFLIWTITPVVYTFLLSISDAADLRTEGVIPKNPIDNFFINYSSVIFILNRNSSSFSTSFVISLQLGFFTAIGGLSIALPAAYAISRFKFKGRDTSQFLVLATQMFPGIILLIPQFIIWARLGFFAGDRTLDLTIFGRMYEMTIPGGNMRLLGLLLAYFVGAIAYNVWMMKGYFDTLPYDLEEAALIDGSSTLGAFLKIALPLSAPGMVAVSIFTFLGAWNEFALAQIFVGEKNHFSPLPLMFYEYQNTSAPDNPPFFELLSAFSILAALPIMIVFMSLQKLLTGGLTTGGVK